MSKDKQRVISFESVQIILDSKSLSYIYQEYIYGYKIYKLSMRNDLITSCYLTMIQKYTFKDKSFSILL